MAVKHKIPEKAKPSEIGGLELDCQTHGFLHGGELKDRSFYCKASISFLGLDGETPRFCNFHGDKYISKDNERGYYKCRKI